MTIQILFQMVGYRNFKTFYTAFLQQYWRHYFPNLPGYTRFVELISRSIFPLTLFTQLKYGKKTGIYYDFHCMSASYLNLLQCQNRNGCPPARA